MDETIDNFCTEAGIDVLITDNDRGLKIEVNEEDGALWVTLTDGNKILTDSAIDIPEDYQL